MCSQGNAWKSLGQIDGLTNGQPKNNALENICKMLTILFRPRSTKTTWRKVYMKPCNKALHCMLPEGAAHVSQLLADATQALQETSRRKEEKTVSDQMKFLKFLMGKIICSFKNLLGFISIWSTHIILKDVNNQVLNNSKQVSSVIHKSNLELILSF